MRRHLNSNGGTREILDPALRRPRLHRVVDRTSGRGPAGGSDRPSDSRAAAPVDHRALGARREAAGAFPGEGSRGRAERRRGAARRHRVRTVERLRRTDPHADARPARERGTALQQFSYDGALFSDAHGASDGPEPPRQQRRGDHGARDGIPGEYGHPAGERRASGGDAAAQRLQHGGLRQVPRNASLGGLDFRALRPLAHALRVRQVLRFHRRGDEPVGAGDLRRHDSSRARPDARLSLHRRHDEPGVGLDAGPALADAAEAVLRVLRDRRAPCAPSRAEGIHRPLQRQVRPGMGRPSARRPSPARRRWASSRRPPT